MTKKGDDAGLVGLALIAGVVIAVFAFIGRVWEFLLDTQLIWVVLIVSIGIGVWVWRYRKKKERERIDLIMSRVDQYGDDMCQWLIDEDIDLAVGREAMIMGKWDEYGEETCRKLIERTLSPGMTRDMVVLALGQPDTIDQMEATEKYEKDRYIYGVPRQGAAYIWFKDGKVTKIKQ